MPDHQTFLRAICAAPDADGPRLVYADWLEERGECDRAEFIRTQIELDQLGDDPSVLDRKDRAEALWHVHGSAWRGDVPGWVRSVRPRRGFPDWVSCNADDFLRDADALFAAAPVRALTLNETAQRVHKLAECLALRHVADLTVGGNRGGVEELRLWLASPHLAGLRALRYSLSDFRDDGARLLARWPALARLTKLDLALNDIGPAGIEALVNSPNAAGLRELRLSNNELGPRGARVVARSPLADRLTVLDLCANRIGSAGLSAVLAADWPALRTLGLTFNRIDPDGAARLADWPGLARIIRLELGGNPLGPDGVVALARSPHLSQIRSLNLTYTPLGFAGVRAMAAADLGSLSVLEAWHSEIGPAGAVALANAPAMAGLVQLFLGNNPLGDAGAAALAASPVLTGLRALGLDNCRLGPAGVRELASSPNLGTVRALYLVGATLDDAAADALAASPYLAAVTHLSLTPDGLSDRARSSLVDRFGPALMLGEE